MLNQKTTVSPTALTAPTRAVAYVRMSTEHQQYSPANQMAAIRQYADIHSMMILRVYTDEGVSGLDVSKRAGLRKLLSDVASGSADFEKVLVYDVSRWGRFQDTDEPAFYEYLCRLNRIEIIYVVEPFKNDHSPMTTVFKAVKRAMAAEFSRELSVKVSRAMCNLAALGYDQCGACIYGLKHVVVDSTGRPVTAHERLSRKTVKTDRLILAPGPKEEVRVVREIFRRYVDLRETVGQVAAHLNASGLRTRRGNRWRTEHISYMVQCEKYIGTHVYNVTSGKLLSPRVTNDPALWIRVPYAFKGIIDPDVFQKARDRRVRELKQLRSLRGLSNDEVLERLRVFYEKHGSISVRSMRRHRFRPGPMAFVGRFGSLSAAYGLVGYRMEPEHDNWKERRRLIDLRVDVLQRIRRVIETKSRRMFWHRYGTTFRIGRDCSGALQLLKAAIGRDGKARWRHFARQYPDANVHVIGRLNDDDRTARDFYVIPANRLDEVPTTLPLQSGPELEQFYCSDLQTAIDRLKRLTGSKALKIGCR
jgi:DNA invertase Pin-like site-specific DNA recombinase